MATSTSPLTRLAEQLLENAKALDAYNQSQGLPPASFDEESFRDPPLNIENRRRTVISLAQDLKRQAQGPRDLVSDVLNSFTDLASFHFLYRYDIAYHVPLDGEISYAKLADAAGVDEVLLRRMLHMAMMNRIFIETRDGDVRHSAVSKILHQEPGAMDACGFMLEDMFPASTKMVEAMDRHPGSGEPNEAAFNVAFKTELPFCKALESAPERARRFGAAMRWMSRGSRFSHNHLIRGYDWAALDQAGGCVVDVGGGHGAVSVALAHATRQLHFVVQDLPGTARHGEKQLPSSLKGRVEFMAHDFFAEQPVRGADVYLFRYILHNWSDKYARKILKAIVPAMRDGSRILCIEVLPSNASSTAWSDKQAYNMDMISAMSSNSIERKSDDWQNLFSAVDSRLQYLGARTPPGCAVSLIEARFSQTT